MKNKMMIASLLAVGALTVGVSTFAYQGNPGVANEDCSDTERHAAVEAVFENGDYNSFQELYADKGVMRKITTEDQFKKFAELREANLNGDTDKVNELKAELNLGQKRMDGNGSKWWMGEWSQREGRGQGQGRLNK